MSFPERLQGAAKQIDRDFDRIFLALPSAPVIDAMRYALRGGKALRGFFVLESAALYEVPAEHALFCATAIEALHAYSLVHDDLPAMDDDDLRRGQPTVHKKWDDATAILAGDALQTLAFELIARGDVHPHRRVDLSLSLAQAAGARGMVYGQALDIAAETATIPLELDDIIKLQSGKTGALFSWSLCAGPRLAGADTTLMRKVSEAIGVAFQIADDLLDVEGDEALAGKRLHKDEQAGKATFVSLLGVAGAHARARELIDEALDGLAVFGTQADGLRDAAEFVIARGK